MSVRTTYGKRGEFPMTIGLYWRSALSHYLFTKIMDDLTTHIQEEVPCVCCSQMTALVLSGPFDIHCCVIL